MRRHLIVLTRHAKRTAAALACSTKAAMPHSGQEVEQIDIAKVLEAAGLKLLVPIRRRTEVLARLVETHLIVGLTLLAILQHLVGFLHLFELLLGVFFLGHIRMVLARELTVGLLDIVFRGRPFDTQNLVIVLVFHPRASRGLIWRVSDLCDVREVTAASRSATAPGYCLGRSASKSSSGETKVRKFGMARMRRPSLAG